MIHRLLDITHSESFFLLGARGTGKSTLVRQSLIANTPADRIRVYDLLDPETEDCFVRTPARLEAEVAAHLQRGPLDWVVLDEVQHPGA